MLSAPNFAVIAVEVERFALTPTLAFRLAIEDGRAGGIQSIALSCQIRIEPQRRGYAPAEGERLLELFGERARWPQTVRSFLWTHAAATVTGFATRTEISLPVACSYDLEVAANKYLAALGDGDIPLLFLFSGTVFMRTAQGLAVEPIAWDREASFALPVAKWRQMMDLYFPDGGWLRLRRETIDALARFKADRALVSWDETIEHLLEEKRG